MAKAWYTFLPLPPIPPIEPGTLAMPTGVTATPGDGEILVDFTPPPVATPPSYRILRRNLITGILTERVVQVDLARPISLSATNGQQHGIRVRSENGAEYSDYTAEVFATPVDVPTPTLAPPTNVTAQFGNAQITENWTPPTQPNLIGYDIELTRPSGVEIITLGFSVARPYIITDNIINGQPHSLRMRSIYGAGNSSWTPTQTGTPTAGTGNLSGYGFLGDSNTIQEGYVPVENRRWPNLVSANMGQSFVNYGEGGATTTDFLAPAKMAQWKGGNHAIYFILFGLNDADDGVPTATYKASTLTLINEVESMGAQAVLITMKHYDFIGGHHSFDRNILLETYNARYRELANEQSVLLVDFYNATKSLDDSYNAGNTTTRSLYGTNYQRWNTHLPSVIPPVNPDDWDNVHFNDYGSKVLEETAVAILRPTTGNIVTKAFTEHYNDDPSPMRGVTHIHAVYSSFGNNHPRFLGTVDSNIRIAQFRYVWHDFLTSDISGSMLNHLSTDLATARSQGIKVIYWPSYWSNGPVYPGMTEQYGGVAAGQARDLGKVDTTAFWVKRHWNQVAPIINANRDVIAWVQIGSMGAWGEGNKSNSGLDYDNEFPGPGVKEIGDHVLGLLDWRIKLAWRYLPALRTMYGAANVTPSEAHTNVIKARIGGWDDFAGDGVGDQVWKAAQNLYFPYHGESVPGGGRPENLSGNAGLNFFRTERWTAFQPFDNDFTDTWIAAGVYDDILRGLGYRFELRESRIPSSVGRNNPLAVILKIKNSGFANVVNEYVGEIVLRNKSTNAYTKLLGLADLRLGANAFPFPGITKDCTLTATVPSGQTPGNYQVLIHLADVFFRSPNSSAQRKFSIPFKSIGVFDGATAYNAVGDVTIT